MLLATPGNTLWRRRFLWSLALTTGSYVVYAIYVYPHGGSLMGLIYGVIGSIIIVLLMYFGVRKRSYKSTLGTLEDWLHAHIYLGILVFFIILFHSGFRFHDKVATTAFILLALVFLSGIIGVFLYTYVPPLLIDVESKLSAEQISSQINQLAQVIRRLASDKSPAFRDYCANLLRTEQPKSLAGWRIMAPAVNPRAHAIATPLASDLELIPPAERAEFIQLLALANQMKDLRETLIHKQRYINIMAAWLYVHVPLSFAMLVAIFAHIIAFFFYW
jgi:hypothetical protein